MSRGERVRNIYRVELHVKIFCGDELVVEKAVDRDGRDCEIEITGRPADMWYLEGILQAYAQLAGADIYKEIILDKVKHEQKSN